ncbi:glutathione S-transferase [Cohaesibacter celericrescens]|uniref:Glutathione S-transferase n=1 Tax=Cohaesibacter celericrescens TaxID=2067669 RepID=A0A2N5XKR9_9HYPH|nr:glutathione S-transferase [Cohaesibacter celericrescens]PLW75065.1 glutathione S-transferase [Cohaesibacter celericrescens]
MVALTLYIANKNYSSWSFRPWLALKAKNIPFTEHFSPFDEATGHAHFIDFSPTKKVPVLKIEEAGKDTVTICESLAILEAVADLYPDANLWPADRTDRALARSYAAEMHGGFFGLRGSCPMNMRRDIRPLDLDPYSAAAVVKNVERIEQIWFDCLEKSGGPFLFGAFGAVDAMYAPVVNRLEKYALTNSGTFRAYRDAVKALPAWQEWEEAALQEPWIVEEDEA